MVIKYFGITFINTDFVIGVFGGHSGGDIPVTLTEEMEASIMEKEFVEKYGKGDEDLIKFLAPLQDEENFTQKYEKELREYYFSVQ